MAKKQTLESLANGCPVYTLVGAYWLVQADILQGWVDTAWAVVERGELKEIQLRSGEANEESIDKPYTLQNGIAKITMSGPMTKYPTSFSSLFGGVVMQHMREVLREVRNNPDIRGVFVDADSPGGTAEGTAELADAIRKTNAVKPVYFHAEDKACSGMLWVATQGSRFTAGPIAAVGSQGTMLRLMDSSQMVKASGLKPIIIATGPYKGIGQPGVEISKEHIQELERFVKMTNEPFKQAVISGRKLTPKQIEEVATARVFVGEDAKRVGLLDAICSADEAYDQFSEQLSSKTSVPVRPGNGVQQSAAPTRRKGMLSPEQLAEVRQLPGAAAVTEENADTFLLSTLKATQTNFNQVSQQLTTANTKIADLNTKIVEKIDPKLAAGHIKLFTKELDAQVKAGNLLPEQSAILKGAVMNGDAPKAEAVASDGTILLSADVVNKVVELNKPNGLVGEVTGGQPQPRQEPGNDKPSEKPVTAERKAQLLGLVGITPGENGNGQH